MSSTLSFHRAATVHPGAQVQASRALRRAEDNTDVMAALGQAARELTVLVAQAGADGQTLHGRLRAYDALQSQAARGVEGERLAAQLASSERYAQALRHELTTLEQELGQVQASGAQLAQHRALGQQLAADGQDVTELGQDLAALRDAMGRRDGLTVVRQQANSALRRSQDVLTDVVAESAHRSDVAQSLLAAQAQGPAATPPSWMLPELGSFVEDWNRVVRDPRGLDAPAKPGAPTDGRVAAIQTRWTAWNLRTQAPKHMDPNELTQWVMQQAYRDNTQDLRTYAVKLEFHTALKARLREELNRARLWRSEHPPKPGETTMTAPFQKQGVPLEPLVDAEGNWHLRQGTPGEEVANPEILQDYIRELEQGLQTVGDDMQMSQIELQMMSQRQQQLLNSLSSLSKAQHETSMAILRKIGT